jgi:hypothetical protein
MKEFNRGEVVTEEAGLEEYTPFGNYAYADPDSVPKISVRDKTNTLKVTSQDMSKQEDGKYYYHIQTAADWEDGEYSVEIVAIYSGVTNTHIKNKAFHLN